MFRAALPLRLFAAPTLALMNTGKVVSWRDGRGFGFIEDDADKKQHFVHFSALQAEAGGYRSLTVDQLVEFEVSTGPDGRTRADNVTAVGGGKLPSGPRSQDNFNRGGGGGGGRGFNNNNNRSFNNRNNNRNFNNNNNDNQGGFGGGRGNNNNNNSNNANNNNNNRNDSFNEEW